MRSFDQWLSAACVLGLMLVSWGLTLEATHHSRTTAAVVGKLTHAQSAIRRRPEGTLGWDVLTLGDDAFANDTIFVPPGTDAVLTLSDGTALALEENSLLALDNRDDKATLTLERGAMTSRGGERGTQLTIGNNTASLEPGSVVRMDASARVDVLAGKLSLAGTTLEEGSSGSVQGGFSPQRGVLLSPAPGERIYSRTVVLRYKTKDVLTVQVSADPSFSKVEVASASYVAATYGQRYWRLVDAEGKPASTTSYFVTMPDVPPALLTPRDREYLVAKKATDALFFAWTETDGATEYLLEVAADDSFAKPTMQKRVIGTAVTITELDEGIWYWRVHAERKGNTPSATATARSFRLTRKPLPHAPELFDPELELKRPR